MLDRQTGSFTIDLIYNSGGNKKKLSGDRQILSIKLESIQPPLTFQNQKDWNLGRIKNRIYIFIVRILMYFIIVRLEL